MEVAFAQTMVMDPLAASVHVRMNAALGIALGFLAAWASLVIQQKIGVAFALAWLEMSAGEKSNSNCSRLLRRSDSEPALRDVAEEEEWSQMEEKKQPSVLRRHSSDQYPSALLCK